MKQKLKTHKAMAKRVKITGSGKFMRRKVALNHLRRNKSPQAVRSMAYMYRDRRNRKRDMRRLWITRINASARMHGVSYSKLMHAIHTANIEVDRKILAEMAVHDEAAFSALVNTALETIS